MNESQAHLWQSPELAEKYLTGVRGAIPLAAEQIDVMLQLLQALDRPVQRFLDLGCGNGILTAAILEKHPHAHGVLLDFAPAMIDAARAALQDHADQLRFVLADYGQIDWIRHVQEYTPFDTIVSGFSIHHQPDERKQSLYRQIFELLRPGGIFVNIEHVASPTSWLAQIFDRYFIDALYAMHQQNQSGKTRAQVADEFYNRPDKVANILAPVETQCAWLRDIGFGDVDCYFKIFELAVFGGRRPAKASA